MELDWKRLKKRGGKLFMELLQDSRYTLLYDHRLPTVYERMVAVKNATTGGMIRLEASSVCQLRCPACSTARGKNRRGVIGWGFLKFADFAKFIEENPQVKTIEISNWGEVFLNPELDAIIQFAYEKGVYLKAANGVNLNTVSHATLENLVKYQFRHLSVSIDGGSHETYRLYRRKGSFNRVIRNIKTINYFKEKYQSPFPKLNWQFVIFGHNEHELPLARELARELNMEFRPKLNHTPEHSPIMDKEFVRKEGGFKVASRDEFASVKRRAYSRPCTQLWDSPQINWDGKLLGCCVNKFGDFGNVFEDGLNNTLNSEKYQYAQKMVLGLAPQRDAIPCIRCKVYRTQIAGHTMEEPRAREKLLALVQIGCHIKDKITELVRGG
ncbi:SPASM domain-containing protein [Myxococcota bacterium]|nr:SPASM domain-containing protein [Myxococcota bacterium]